MDSSILNRYAAILKNRQFVIYSSMAALAESIFFCFFSTSPFIIINLLGIPMQEFGYYFAAFGAVVAGPE